MFTFCLIALFFGIFDSLCLLQWYFLPVLIHFILTLSSLIAKFRKKSVFLFWTHAPFLQAPEMSTQKSFLNFSSELQENKTEQVSFPSVLVTFACSVVLFSVLGCHFWSRAFSHQPKKSNTNRHFNCQRPRQKIGAATLFWRGKFTGPLPNSSSHFRCSRHP